MSIPAVVAHGGAGAGPERLANVERAVAIAAGILESGGSAVEASVEACAVLEDDPVFNAGTGSVFRTDGTVLLDASIQVSDGRMGFVIAMEDTPNPIRVAADLLDEQINGLTGEGARSWADAQGFSKTPVEGRPPFKGATDTVGVITRDRSGSIACATSTGGAAGMRILGPRRGRGWCDRNWRGDYQGDAQFQGSREDTRRERPRGVDDVGSG